MNIETLELTPLPKLPRRTRPLNFWHCRLMILTSLAAGNVIGTYM